MACSIEYIDYICEILAPLGEVRYRKMMGDYVIYVNGKCVITACDNCAYIKKLKCVEDHIPGWETGYPYKGAKECYIMDFTEERKVREVISILWEELPFPKKKT